MTSQEKWTCAVCGEAPSFEWCDYHGVAQHRPCGAPYRLYHYENEKRVDKAPELLISSAYLDAVRRYWAETRRAMPGGHSFGHRGDSGAQEMATRDDAEAFYAWIEANGPDAMLAARKAKP
jgi:hypothetical protein